MSISGILGRGGSTTQWHGMHAAAGRGGASRLIP
jgi:hypothetical protein